MSPNASRLAELIASIAPYLDDVVASRAAGTQQAGSGSTVYRRGDREFARMGEDALEVRLPAEIAEAATRTPDTVFIAGQPGWVRFTPTSDERHVGDRAEAWFRTAWRHAAGSS